MGARTPPGRRERRVQSACCAGDRGRLDSTCARPSLRTAVRSPAKAVVRRVEATPARPLGNCALRAPQGPETAAASPAMSDGSIDTDHPAGGYRGDPRLTDG